MPQNHSINVAAFVDAYIECALWSSTDESDETGGCPLDENYGPGDLTQQARDEMRCDCVAFIEHNADGLAELSAEQAGHDFWLTRNRHGSGFWDRGLGELGERLTREADAYGESYLYIGDDGRIHLF